MNKIQLRAQWELAEMDFSAKPTEQTKAALEAAKKAFEDFDKHAETTATGKPQKKANGAKKAEEKQEKAESEQEEAPVETPSEEKKTG